jgi:glycosyltransferase involved in cell wall biosynthesis
MKVCGFTFVRNAIKYDYPVVASLQSILPLCDEIIVAVGNSDDRTRELVNSIAPNKIRIIDTIWDETLREGGKVLAVETNKAFHAVPTDADWCFYIQADEVVHENDVEAIKNAMLKYVDDKRVDGLLFNWLHFYGSYNFVGNALSWYDKEIRIIRNDRNIYSYRDAQGFRKGDNEKLNVKQIEATIYHYGWVKHPKDMQRKQTKFHSLWHDNAWIERVMGTKDEYDYQGNIDTLLPFRGTHPSVMQERISKMNWTFNYDLSQNKLSLKRKLKLFAKEKLGMDFSYRNYKLI